MAVIERRRLKLLAQNLTDVDQARIAAFLRVSSARFYCRWELVPEGDAHLLLSGCELPDSPTDETPVLTVMDPQIGRPDDRLVLVRPLEYEPFVEALCALEVRLLGLEPPPPSGLTWLTAQPLGEVTPVLLPALMPGALCRLRRWPPVAMLQAHRHNRRLAGFMATRYIGLDELAHLTDVDRRQCEEFAEALLGAGLLDVQPARPANASAANRGHTTMPASSAGFGLFKRIRRGLGLG
jgi:hypothetical protein